jgi:hypothetical protein
LREGKGEGSSDYAWYPHFYFLSRENNEGRKPMRRKIICVVLATILLATISPAEAQQQAKVAKIGYVATGSGSGSSGGHELLRRELRELGYVEGKNIAFEYRYGDRQT